MLPRQLALALVLLLILPLISVADSSFPPPTNLRLTNHPTLQNEQQIFICPTDSNVVIANWRDFRIGFRQIGVGRSTDGGQTWTDSLINRVMQEFNIDSKQSDPTITVDRLGNFYMTALDWDAFGLSGLSTISVYRTTDKGVTWTGPVPAMWTGDPSIFEDKQFTTVDRTGGPHDGNFYLSWTRFPNPDRIIIVRSTDGAQTFDDTVTVGPVQTSTGCGANIIDAGQFSIPFVAPDGDVHVMWQGFSLDSSDQCSGMMMMKHCYSEDGGVTYTPAGPIFPVSGYMTANGGVNTYSQPAADADISDGPFDGNYYVAYTNVGNPDNGRQDVFFRKSSGTGEVWTEPILINDADSAHLMDAFHPWLIVNQEGVIIVLFYDQRYDAPGYLLFDCMAAYSFDGGESFSTNHRISDVSSSPFNLKFIGEEKPVEYDEAGIPIHKAFGTRAGLIGEYIGVSAFHDKVVSIWTDSRDGNSECYSANWYIPLLEPRLMSPANGNYVTTSLPSLHWATAWKHNQDSYRVELATDPSFATIIREYVVDTNMAFVDSNLTSTDPYYWRAKAFDLTSGDSSEYSQVWSFMVDFTAPSAPSLVEPIDGLTTGNLTPTFVWSAVDDGGSPVTYTLELVYGSPTPTDTVAYAGLTDTLLILPDSLPADVAVSWNVTVQDLAGNPASSANFTFNTSSFVCGDANGSGTGPDISDLVYLVAFMFNGGPPPPVMAATDVDGIYSGTPDIADLVYLVAYMFSGGPDLICP